jgi:site-specific DNA recombinase
MSRNDSRKADENGATGRRRVRCAIYTRKSSDEGLDQEFNSLDAQRESAEAFIASQKAEGWEVLPETYNDGGFSGGSIERPALQRLLRDIEEGKLDCVVVYKVDRLSRSLLDFARIMEIFDRHNVSFVSVTQQFNTTHSMGRLTLNILLSFAQFEREIIGERIRDKIAAQKRKGKWAGGVPVLGYDVDRSGPSPRLVVNAAEATRVRTIFQIYLEKGSMLPVVGELSHRGWVNKRRVTKKGKELGGRPFDRATLYQLLTNPIYTGKISHKGQLYDGEHPAIIDADLFAKVQEQLQHNGRTGGVIVRNKYGALLRGLLRCKQCNCAMSHAFSRNRSGTFYRYYRCSGAIKNGARGCPNGSLPAAEIERVVVDEVRQLGEDKGLLQTVLNEATAALTTEVSDLSRDRDHIKGELTRHHAELRRMAAGDSTSQEAINRMADLHEQVADAERRLAAIAKRLGELERETITPAQADTALARFDDVWNRLIPREQARLLNLLIASVEFDGLAGTISVTFRPTSIQALIRQQLEEAA